MNRSLCSRNSAVVLIATLSAAAIATADEVVLEPDASTQGVGGRIRGRIERETPEQVVIAGRTVPLEDVAEVSYDAPGLNYTQAALQESNGNLEEAAELYEAAANEASNRYVAESARFRRAAILARLARSDPDRRDEAIGALETIVQEMSSSRHYGPALKLLADLHLANQDHDAADAALQRLAELSWAVDEAAVLRAEVKAKRGQSDEALADLERLLGSFSEGSEAHRRASLAKAEALVGVGRYDEAEQAARSVIDAADPENAATLAPAYNTLGDCLRAAGRPRDALFAYLHTDILYPSQADEHARSLAAIAQLWRVLDRGDRAQQVVERLEQEYPNSPHLSAASEPTGGG